MTPKLNAIGIVVSDMAASLAFYRQLGLDIPASADADAHAEVTLDGGMRLMFDTAETIKSFMPGYQKSSGVWGSLAFECDSPATVDNLFWTLTQAGYHGEMEPWDAFWGQRYAVMHDPDGNGVDLYAPSR
jgi:uncharacterized glyoxalase superfamily protein PhnB